MNLFQILKIINEMLETRNTDMAELVLNLSRLNLKKKNSKIRVFQKKIFEYKLGRLQIRFKTQKLVETELKEKDRCP